VVLQLSDNLNYPIIFEHSEKNGYPILSDICENYRISDNKLSERTSSNCSIAGLGGRHQHEGHAHTRVPVQLYA